MNKKLTKQDNKNKAQKSMVIDRKSIVISLLNKMARIKINAKF
jgi:hypothetical protein